MKISRTCDSRSLDAGFYDSIDCLLFGTVTDEERNRRLLEIWGNTAKTRGYHMHYDLDTEEFSLLPTPFGSVPIEQEIVNEKKDITTHLGEELLKIGVRDKRVLIDTTGISQPAIFFLLKLFYEDIQPANLFLAYTEPLRYKPKIFPSSEDCFELTDRFIGLKALPGFLKKTDREKKSLLVLLIGFEGKRAKYVCEALETESSNIRIILGFPGFKPGWQYLAYGSNQSIFEVFQAYRFVWPAAANDPFEVYNALVEIQGEQIKSGREPHMALAPVGTKPHAVGAAMFALHNSDYTRIVYDFPVKARHYRSEGYGPTWVYNFSSLIKKKNGTDDQ